MIDKDKLISEILRALKNVCGAYYWGVPVEATFWFGIVKGLLSILAEVSREDTEKILGKLPWETRKALIVEMPYTIQIIEGIKELFFTIHPEKLTPERFLKDFVSDFIDDFVNAIIEKLE